MRYKFPFATLLKHKKRLEEGAQKEFLEAQKAVDDCLQGIQAIYDSMDKARLEIAQMQAGSYEHKIEVICHSENFILGQSIKLNRERERARELIQTMEQKQKQLKAAAIEHKVLSKLKERKTHQFRVEERKKEEKRMSDLVSMRSAFNVKRGV